MTESVATVPLYKQSRFVFAAGVIVVVSGLLVYHFVDQATWNDIVKYTIGAFLGGAQ